MAPTQPLVYKVCSKVGQSGSRGHRVRVMVRVGWMMERGEGRGEGRKREEGSNSVRQQTRELQRSHHVRWTRKNWVLDRSSILSSGIPGQGSLATCG